MLKYHHPDKDVEIWAQDEARLGLQPVTRKVWAVKGQRPVALHERKYEWLYAYSYVKPSTGDNFWVLMPEARTDVMALTLQEFSQYHNPKQNKIIILLIDRAGWHMSPDLEIPANIRLFPLPPYTPQLQPVECIIPLLKESVANRSFKDMDTLEDTLVNRCKWLMKHIDIVKGAVGFDWIVNIEGRTD